MRSSVQTFILDGVEAIPCRVEVAILDEKTPRTTVVGLPDAAVREAVDRVQAAMEAGGFGYPPGRITINLSPATHRKEGPLYDLPIAVAVLLASGELGVDARARVRDCVIAGELRLDGTLQAIPGAVAMADLAARSGIGNVLLPSASADAAALVDRIRSRPAHCLGDIIRFLSGQKDLPVAKPPIMEPGNAQVDMADLRGQMLPRRALTVAAAGWVLREAARRHSPDVCPESSHVPKLERLWKWRGSRRSLERRW